MPRKISNKSGLGRSQAGQKVRDARRDKLNELSGKSKAFLPTKRSTAFEGVVDIALKQKKKRKKDAAEER